jgi:hypothetical protein
MNRLVPFILATALAAAGAAAPVAAQTPLDVRVIPRAGVLTPAGWFYVQYTGFLVDPVEWTEAAILRAPVLGLAVEVEVPGTDVWLRGEALRSVDAITSVVHAVRRGTSGFDPPRVDRTPYRVATTMTTATVDLALPTRLRIGPVQPYVTAGIGGKWYGFDTGPFQELEVEVILPQPGFVGVVNVGGGAVVRLLGLDLDVQVRDAISMYWNQQQHDVMTLIGIAWDVF